MEDRKEKLFNSYLNSVVGANPVLIIETKRTRFLRSMQRYLTTDLYYINNIKVGSKAEGATKISMDMELYNRTRTLFGLKPNEVSQYFNDWLIKIPQMNKIIQEYLNSKFPNEFNIHYVDSREVQIKHNDIRIAFVNPRSGFISYQISILIEIKNWFGEIQYNELRPIINNWLFQRYNVTNVNEFRNHIMDNKDIYKS